jgi:hypothetical protein
MRFKYDKKRGQSQGKIFARYLKIEATFSYKSAWPSNQPQFCNEGCPGPIEFDR